MRDRHTTLGTALLLLAGSICLVACDEPRPTQHPINVHYSQCLSMPQSARRSVDLLFVIDDSSAVAGFEQRLAQNMAATIAAIQGWSNELPDLHLGVVTTVLGTGPYAVEGCPLAGHEGQMHTGSGAGPVGATYLQDVKPSGCTIDCPDATGICATHTCSAANCEHEPGTWLVIDDDTGCPRCRNYHGTLVEAFMDIGSAGVSDCPFSQPLEAMGLALQSDANLGFLRDDAFLGILFVTAQDDCSAEDTRLFDSADTALGPLSPFRCFAQGVTCDVDGREPGARHDCVPREDAESLIRPLSDYVTLLQGIKDPQMLVVAGVVGPFDGDAVVTVELDPQGDPRLASSCTQDATLSATPGVRLHHFLAAFNEVEDLSTWAQTSMCDSDYTTALRGGHQTGCTNIEPPCFELPVLGCVDPGAAVGEPRDGQTCNDACAPNCVVTDVHSRGLPDETEVSLPHCLEVCDDGPCPGNTDPALAYAGGRPADRDFRLPADACWYISAEGCAETSQLIVARRADPPPRSFVSFCCELVPNVEDTCDDGVDNDEDLF